MHLACVCREREAREEAAQAEGPAVDGGGVVRVGRRCRPVASRFHERRRRRWWWSRPTADAGGHSDVVCSWRWRRRWRGGQRLGRAGAAADTLRQEQRGQGQEGCSRRSRRSSSRRRPERTVRQRRPSGFCHRSCHSGQRRRRPTHTASAKRGTSLCLLMKLDAFCTRIWCSALRYCISLIATEFSLTG